MEEGGEWKGDFDPFADPEERRVLFAVLDSFRQYRRTAHYNVTHVRRQNFYALPSSQWELLASPPFSILDSFDAVDDAIDANAEIAEKVLEAGLAAYGLDTKATSSKGFETHGSGATQHGPSPLTAKPAWHDTTTTRDLEKARSTIRQFYRDWSEEGSKERADSYEPIRLALSKYFKHISPSSRHQIQVLVPGAGLGRLVFDLVQDGYSAEGNEISYHQLLASHFILNCTTVAQEFALYPWALHFDNHLSREHQLQKVMIPDVHPANALYEASQKHEVPASERMSMTAADFCVHYRSEGEENRFDAVTTVFFIDTAPNLLNYIETVQHCLKSGGIWINSGPLLWHSGKELRNDDDERTSEGRNLGIGEAGSVELTHGEVIKLLKHYGFEIIDSRETAQTGYIDNPRSMQPHTFKPQHWIARKE
ncbi:MAG: hypothetical protein Q9165_003609 [Trypethelium subeluteriae]